MFPKLFFSLILGNGGFCPAGGNLWAPIKLYILPIELVLLWIRLFWANNQNYTDFHFILIIRPSYSPRESMREWFRCWRWVCITVLWLLSKEDDFYPPQCFYCQTIMHQVAFKNLGWSKVQVFIIVTQWSLVHSAPALERGVLFRLPQCFSLAQVNFLSDEITSNS